MKKIASICAGLFLISSAAVFAGEDHAAEAMTHAKAAVEHGKAGHPNVLVDHAKLALEHALAGSLSAHGPAKNHLDAAANSLQSAIDKGGLDKTAEATKAAEDAISHIQASTKK